jgi:hypothetical protein
MIYLSKTRTKIHTNLTKTTFLLKFIFNRILYPFLSLWREVQAISTDKYQQLNPLKLKNIFANFEVYLKVINLKVF